MTASRPPGSSRHADTRSPEREAANPLQRPLPPGMGRRSAEPDVDRGRPAAPAAPAAPGNGAGPAANPFRGPSARPAPATRPAGGPARRARPVPADRAPVSASAIPLTAPPAWQVAETEAEERQLATRRTNAPQRGLPGWLGLAVLLVITGIGGLIDAVAGAGIKGTFSIGLIVGSLVAILLVRRSSMFPVVVAPPLVYFVASAVLLYIRSGGLSNRAAITDAAASWLVYGFPAIAGATAVVLIVAGVRMILHR